MVPRRRAPAGPDVAPHPPHVDGPACGGLHGQSPQWALAFRTPCWAPPAMGIAPAVFAPGQNEVVKRASHARARAALRPR
eukprot:11189397-Lingulodinium_polyedra.AAC.1